MALRSTDYRSSASANVALMLLALLVPLLDRGSAAEYDPQTQRPWGCRTCSIPTSDVPPGPVKPGL